MSPNQTYTRSLPKTPKVSNVVLTVCCVNHYNSHISLVALSYPLDHVWSHSPATQAAAHAVTDSLCGFLTIRRSHGLTSLTWSEPIVLHPSRSVTARSLSSSHLCTVCILCIYWDWDTLLVQFVILTVALQSHLITSLLCPASVKDGAGEGCVCGCGPGPGHGVSGVGPVLPFPLRRQHKLRDKPWRGRCLQVLSETEIKQFLYVRLIII